MADNIGDELRLWRRKVGFTQEELAARIKVSRERYANWERGKVMPPLEFRLALANLGLRGIPGAEMVAEQRAGYNHGVSSDTLSILIDTLYDCDRDIDIRAKARRELYRMLNLNE